MSIHKKLRLVIAASVLAPVLYGCGPGFPIMTSAQEELLSNVETLKRDSADLKARVASIEAGGGLDELNFSLAETNNTIESLRREFSFVQGAVEAADHDKAQTGEDIAALSGVIRGLDERLAAVEEYSLALDERSRAAEERLSAEGEARQAAAAAGAGLEEAMASLERRMVSMEQRLAKIENAGAAKKSADDGGEDPESVYHRGYQLVKDKDYAGAQQVFEGFISRYPSHRFADHAQYWLGEIHYARGDWAKAILEFDKVIKDYPKGGKVAAALLKQGFSFDKLGSAKEARVLLQSVIERFPDSSEAELATKRLETLK